MEDQNSLPPSYDEVVNTPSPSISSTSPFSNVFLNSHHYQIPIGSVPPVTSTASDSYNSINPTLKPYKNFNVKDDVQIISDALTNGPDKHAIIKVLCHRSSDQRMEISQAYFAYTGRFLIQDFNIHFKYYFKLLLAGLSVPYYDYLSNCIHRGVSFNWLHDLLFTIPNAEIKKMKHIFKERYECQVETFIETRIQCHDEERILFKPLIRTLEACRNENGIVSPTEVNEDVNRIASIKSSKIFGAKKCDKGVLTNILYYKSFSHIRAVFDEYQKKYNQPVFDVIERCYFSHGPDILCNIAKYALNKNFYFAYLLKSSMKSLGTDELLLTHIVLRRSEIDLADIKVEFQNLYKKSLEEWIRGYISGHYKNGICALIDEKRET